MKIIKSYYGFILDFMKKKKKYPHMEDFRASPIWRFVRWSYILATDRQRSVREH